MDIFTEAVQHTFLKLVILAFLRAHIRYGGSDKRDFDGMGFYDKTEVAKHRKFTKLLEKTLGNNLSYASVMRVVKPQFPEENYWEILKEIPRENIKILHGEKDLFLCNNGICLKFKELGLDVIDIPEAGHDWHKNFDDTVVKIINSKK